MATRCAIWRLRAAITYRQHLLPTCYGKEFAGRLLDQWAYLNKVEPDFSRPGKPTDNAYIEAFKSRLRQECLNASWFLSMDLPGKSVEHQLRNQAAFLARKLDPETSAPSAGAI